MALSSARKTLGVPQRKAADTAPTSTAATSNTLGQELNTFGEGTGIPTQSSQKKQSANPGAVTGWMKKGHEAKAAMDQADAQAEKAKQEASKIRRFWMPSGSQRTITFLYGDLGDDGLLDTPVFIEHRVKVNGDWETFVCVGGNEPCPGCASSKIKAGLVGVMTIMDHTPTRLSRARMPERHGCTPRGCSSRRDRR
jgi:hypothetical protein